MFESAKTKKKNWRDKLPYCSNDSLHVLLAFEHVFRLGVTHNNTWYEYRLYERWTRRDLNGSRNGYNAPVIGKRNAGQVYEEDRGYLPINN
jgi:hypothetical protein